MTVRNTGQNMPCVTPGFLPTWEKTETLPEVSDGVCLIIILTGILAAATGVCYHGVMDMFRNPKLAAAVYASQQNKTPVLEVSSSMDIGDHPAGQLGKVIVFTNGDFVRLYKNDEYVGSYGPSPAYGGMKHPPVIIEDTVGSLLERKEGYDQKTARMVKDCLYGVVKYGPDGLPKKLRLKMAWLFGSEAYRPGENEGTIWKIYRRLGRKAPDMAF